MKSPRLPFYTIFFVSVGIVLSVTAVV